MLKYEMTAEIGDVIKAFDFEPMPSREDSFLIGRVVDKGEFYQDFDGNKVYLCDGYTVEIIGGDDDSRNGVTMCVPFETSMDYEGRVSLVEAA